ncbi:MAG: hypothetical protein AAF730_06410, partial [Bacteroidota bacterium]
MNIASDMVHRTHETACRLWMPAALLLAFMLAFGGQRATAQIAEVQLNFPATLPTPFVGEITDELEAEGTRFGQFIFIYTNPANPSPVEFIFTIDIDGPDGPLLTDIVSDPAALLPGVYTYPPFSQGASSLSFGGLTTDEVLDMIGTDYLTDVVLSGVLAEGNYTVQIRVTSVDGSVPEAIGFTSVQILYPESAVLVAPGDGDEVSAQVPFFQWNAPAVPPGVQLEYEVLLVELLEGQNPQEALIGNRAHYEETFLGQTSFAYTPDLLPLAPGREYAWQVTTRDAAEPDRPFKDDGESEIYTFVYGSRELGAPVVTEPLRQAEVTSDQVRFAWTAPANLPPGYTALDLEYEIVVVEAPEGTTAEEALLSGGPQHALIRVPAGLSTFTYGMLGSAPLLVGQTYAWQLRARDARGDLEEGLSDPRLFTIIPSAFVIPEPVIAMSPAAGQPLAEVPSTLIWAMPGTSPLTEADFEVLIVEVPEGETPESAFNDGSPDDALLVYQATHFAGGLAASMPVTHSVSGGGVLRSFELGKTYAWGVGTLYGQEEAIWSAASTFTLQITDEVIDPIGQISLDPVAIVAPDEGDEVYDQLNFIFEPVAANATQEVTYQVLLTEWVEGADRADLLGRAEEIQASGIPIYRSSHTYPAGQAPGVIQVPFDTANMNGAPYDNPLLALANGQQYFWQIRIAYDGYVTPAEMPPSRVFTYRDDTDVVSIISPDEGEEVLNTLNFVFNSVETNASTPVTYQVLLTEWTDGADRNSLLGSADEIRNAGIPFYRSIHTYPAGAAPGVIDVPFDPSQMDGANYPNKLVELENGKQYFWQVRIDYDGYEAPVELPPSRVFTFQEELDFIAIISPDEGEEVYNELSFVFEPVAANATQEVMYQVLLTEWVEGADRATLIDFNADRIRASGIPFYRGIYRYAAGEAPDVIAVPFDPAQMDGANYPNKLLTLESGKQYFWQIRIGYDGYSGPDGIPPSRAFTYQDVTDLVTIISPDEGEEVYNELRFVFNSVEANAGTEVTYQV